MVNTNSTIEDDSCDNLDEKDHIVPLKEQHNSTIDHTMSIWIHDE